MEEAQIEYVSVPYATCPHCDDSQEVAGNDGGVDTCTNCGEQYRWSTEH